MDYIIKENEPMSLHTTFKVGGPAKKYIKPLSEEGLTNLLYKMNEEGEAYIVIGNGSNLLVSDKGIDGVVVEIGDGLSDIVITDNTIYAGAGARLSSVAKAAADAGLSGLEFASGIPGSVGGAVYMNAGAYGGEMKDCVKSVKVFKESSVSVIDGEKMGFSYRHSIAMEEDMIVIGATFVLSHDDKDKIFERMNDFNSRRREKQPLELPSAGSTFKRPEGYFAGKLIMDAGLSGASVGGAMVSPKHCGFVVNTGDATASDIYNLIQNVKAEVMKQFGVELEPEVKMFGEF